MTSLPAKFAAGALGAAVLIGLLVSGAAGAVRAPAIPGETALAYTGAEQRYTVPRDVLLLGIDAAGASGGGGNVGASLGGYVPVHGGQTLYAEVGQQGAFGGGPTFGGGGPAGQFPGCAGCAQNSAAGSGGGSSDVRTCSEKAAGCPGGGSSDASRLLVAGGGSGAGGQGSGPGFYCTELPQKGDGFNQQNRLPTGNASDGPVPIVTAAGIVIPGEASDFSYGGPIKDVTAATGGSTAPGTGGALGTCTVYEVNNGSVVSAIFAPTVPGTSGSGSQGAAGASISGTAYAAAEGSSGFLPGAGGGGGGGYTGGGSGAAGYVCTYTVHGGPCYNPSAGASGGGGSSFESRQVKAPYIDDGIPGPAATVTIAPLVVVRAPQNGATYAPGKVLDAAWACGGGGTPFQGSSCSATVASGKPIRTTPGTHKFTVKVSTPPFNVIVPVTITYKVRRRAGRSGRR